MGKGTEDKFLEQGEKLLAALEKQATGFDEKFKVFTAWARFQEIKQRIKRGGMGSGFDELEGGTGDERPDL